MCHQYGIRIHSPRKEQIYSLPQLSNFVAWALMLVEAEGVQPSLRDDYRTSRFQDDVPLSTGYLQIEENCEIESHTRTCHSFSKR